ALAAEDRELRDPATSPPGLPGGGTIAETLLDAEGKMHCTSCHDVHASDRNDHLLRWDYGPAAGSHSSMCLACHDK
ncbi:MAG: cytochrome c3 family protein, partial [Planctomycetota bacterium]